MASYSPRRKSCTQEFTTVMRCANGDTATFCSACRQAPESMSIAVTEASGKRCAIIRAISPVPVPMSSTRFPPSAHAPSNVPSVPTFIAQPS